MTSGHPQPVTRAHYDDEIDLMELLGVLWQGKYIILVSTFIFALLGAAKAFNDREWWVATAKVEEPRYVAYQQMHAYASRAWPQDPERLLTQIGYGSTGEVFSKFIQDYESTDSKRRFILDQGVGLQASISLQAEPAQEGRWNEQLLNYWMSEITASSGRNETAYTLRFAGGTPKESELLLKEYIVYNQRQLSRDFLEALQGWVETTKDLYRQRLALRSKQTQAKLGIDIQRLEHALTIARAANVDRPVVDPGISDDFAINLGALAISAKIDELRSIEDLSVIEPEISRLQITLQELEALHIDLEHVFTMVHMLESASLPLSRHSPKRALIIIALTLVGGVLGVLAVFIRHAMRNYKARKPAL